MKKIISFVLSISLIITTSGCGSTTEKQAINESKNIDKLITNQEELFTLDFPTDKAVLNYTLENDNFDILLSSSPLYIGLYTLPIPAYQQFNELKSKKVEEIVELSNGLGIDLNNFTKEINKFQQYSLDFMEKIRTIDTNPEFERLANEIIDQYVFDETKEIAQLAAYNASMFENIEDPYIYGFYEYQKIVLLINITETITEKLSNILLNTAQLAIFYENNENKEIVKALKKLNKQMDSISELNTIQNEIIKKVQLIETGIRQIETADYYFALGAIEYTTGMLQEANKEIPNIEISEDLNKDEKELIADYSNFLIEYMNELKEILEKMDKSHFINTKKLNAKNYLIQTANAGFNDFIKKSYNSIASSTKFVANTGLNLGGKTIKLTWNAGKGIISTGQTIIGTTLDTTSAISKSTMDFYIGLWYGNSLSEIKERQNNNYKTIVENFKQDRPGYIVLQNSEEFLNSVEEGAGILAEGTIGKALDSLVEGTIAEKYPSWAIGGLARLTTGMATQLGKGIYKIANKKSSNWDYFEGAFDIATSMFGGSKAIAPASKVVKGGSKASKSFLQNGFNYVKKILLNKKLEKATVKKLAAEKALKETGLNKLTKTQLKNVVKRNKYEANRLKNLLIKMEEQSSKNTEILKTIIPTTGQAINKNARKIPQTINKIFTDKFEHSFKGYTKAGKELFGNSFIDYFDNLTAGQVDNFIKNLINTYIFSSTTNYDGNYKGTYSSSGFSAPINVEVKNNTITGTLNLSANTGGVNIKINATFSGTVDEKENISGNIASTANISGNMTGSSSASGTFTGAIQENTMTVNYSGFGITNVNGAGSYGGGETGTLTLTK